METENTNSQTESELDVTSKHTSFSSSSSDSILLEQIDTLKKQNEIMEKELLRQEQLKSRLMLASTTGIQKEEKPKVESPKEYAERIMRGENK
jgi:hypothetical protein